MRVLRQYTVFYLTATGHAPTQEFLGKLNRGMADTLRKGREQVHIMAYAGPTYNDPQMLADKMDGENVVLALVEKGEGDAFTCYPFAEHIAEIRRVLKTSEGTSYDVLRRMIE